MVNLSRLYGALLASCLIKKSLCTFSISFKDVCHSFLFVNNYCIMRTSLDFLPTYSVIYSYYRLPPEPSSYEGRY
nr:MAG TPA: hypothetical protein [Caudoviricetes sp.]